MSDCCETVVLVLKDIIFRHTESKFLSEFLTEKYGFELIEDKTKEIKKLKTTMPTFGEDVVDLSETKYSNTQILSGTFSDAVLNINILGEIAQKEDIVEISDKEKYKVYNSKYQLLKIGSKSGYAITQFIERLSVDLGLEIKTKEWFFHRSNNI